MQADAMRQPNTGRRRLDYRRFRRKVARRVRIDRAGNGAVITLYGLIDGFGKRQIRNCIIGIEQRLGLRIES